MADINITVHRRGGFTMVPNSAFDGSLPLSAIGLYAYMLHFPDEWEFSIIGLAKCLKVGEYSVRSGLDKLEEAGFLKRTKLRDDKGHFAGYDYDLYDEKQPLPTENTPNEEPMPEETEEGPPALTPPYDENPHTGDPHVESPHAENRTQYNIINNQDLSNIPPIVPPQEKAKKGSKRGEPRSAPNWKPERFEGLWKFYPQEGRKNRKAAVRAWDKLKPDDALIRRIGKALKVQMQSEMWKKGVGIPYLSTYLNGERWTDVPEKELEQQTEVRSGWSDDAEVVASW